MFGMQRHSNRSEICEQFKHRSNSMGAFIGQGKAYLCALSNQLLLFPFPFPMKTNRSDTTDFISPARRCLCASVSLCLRCPLVRIGLHDMMNGPWSMVIGNRGHWIWPYIRFSSSCYSPGAQCRGTGDAGGERRGEGGEERGEKDGCPRKYVEYLEKQLSLPV